MPNIPLTLIIENKSIFPSIIPVRWSMSDEMRDQLLKGKVKNPQALLITWSKKHGEHRWLVPLKQAIQHLQFHQPGENKIFATIVWANLQWDGNKSKLRKGLIKKDGIHYKFNIITRDGTVCNTFYVISPFEFCEIKVDVSKESFASLPAKWENRWVNLLFKSKAIDQYEFLKRLLIAYTIQPALVSLWIIYKVIFCTIAGILLFASGIGSLIVTAVIRLKEKIAGTINKLGAKLKEIGCAIKEGKKQRELAKMQQYYIGLIFLEPRYVNKENIWAILPKKDIRLRFQKIKARFRPYAL